jgi:hypothetical protein
MVSRLQTVATSDRYIRRLVSAKTFHPDGSVTTARDYAVWNPGAPRLPTGRLCPPTPTGRRGFPDIGAGGFYPLPRLFTGLLPSGRPSAKWTGGGKFTERPVRLHEVRAPKL